MSEQAVAETAVESSAPTGDFFNAIEQAFNAAELTETAATAEPESSSEAQTTSTDNTPATPDSVPEIKDGTEPDEPSLPIDEAIENSVADEPEDGLAGKAGRRFKQLKTELKQANTELQTLKQQLQERESRVQELSASNENVEQYQQRLAEYEQALAITKLESTAAYRNEIQEPMIRLVEAADEIAKRYGIDSDELVDVLSYSDRDKQDDALDNLLQGVKERDKLAVYALAEHVPVIVARKQELSENANAALAELELIDQQRHQEQLVGQLQARKQAAEQVQQKLASKVPFLKSIEGLDFDNVAKRAGEADLDSLDIHNKVYSKMAGDIFPKLAVEFVNLRNELEEALDELESLKKAEPKIGGSTSSGSPSKAAGNFIDAINAALGG
jgi:myosin heavy subunit